MKTEWDEAKSRSNFAKHGLRLEWADFADWTRAAIRPDVRKDYGEDRFVAYLPFGGRLHMVCYTDRGDARRYISFRKANEREIKRYG